MKDEKKKSELPPKPKSKEVPKAKTKHQHENPSAFRSLAAEVEPTREAHVTLLGESASLPANAEPLAEIVEQLQQSYGNTYVQRLISEVRESKSDEALEGESGQHLDADTKAEMESALGEDFGDVRIHTDRKAKEAAEELDARAFTHGQDIYFGEGEYTPSKRSGKELLAHELTHVIQRQGRSVSPKAESVSQADDSFEQEAAQAAVEVLSGQHPHVMSQTNVPAVQQEEKREAPSIRRHAQEIKPTPASGKIDARRFSVAYFYNISTGSHFLPLTLVVPAGVAVAVIPLTDMSPGDYNIKDSGGTGAKAVTISVSLHLRTLPKIQVTLTKGSFTYIVVFQFLQSSASSEASEE